MDAGNTLRKARNVGVLNANGRVFSDRLSTTDKDDLYRINVTRSSSVGLQIAGIRSGARVGLEVLGVRGNLNRVLNRIGSIRFSDLHGSQRNQNLTRIRQASTGGGNRSLTLTLNPGQYFVRVNRLQGQTPYQLRLVDQTNNPTPLPNPLPLPNTPPRPNPGPSPTPTPGPAPTPVPSGTITTLYSGVGLPGAQPLLRYSQIAPEGFTIFGSAPTGKASETVTTEGVTLNTAVPNYPFSTSENVGYAGYTNHRLANPSNPAGSDIILADPNFPSLDRTQGYTISFNMRLNSEISTSANRAGFTVTTLSNDTQGIQLGFKGDRIFAQDSSFNAAESFNAAGAGVALNTLRTYRLVVKDSNYNLFIDTPGAEPSTTAVLTGNLRTYTFDKAKPEPVANPNLALPFNPYQKPSYFYIGDSTDEGRSNFTLGEVKVTTT